MESGFEGGDDGEEGIDASHVQQCRDARGWSDEDEAGAVGLAAAVEVDNFADAGGVHEGDAGDIEDGEEGVILAEFGAEGAQIAEDERAVQAENATGWLGDGGELDLKRFRWHMVVGTARTGICVNSIGKADGKCRA